jgi:hypothetical protein
MDIPMRILLLIGIVVVLSTVTVLVWLIVRRAKSRPGKCRRRISRATDDMTEVQFYIIVDTPNISISRLGRVYAIVEQEAQRFADRFPGAQIHTLGEDLHYRVPLDTISNWVVVSCAITSLSDVQRYVDNEEELSEVEQKRRRLTRSLRTFGYPEGVKSLRGFKKKRIIESLIQVLNNEDLDWQRRQLAADTLAYIGDPRAVEPLVNLLQNYGSSGSMVRGAVLCGVVRALGAIGDPRASDALAQALNDIDDGVRKYASIALGKLGDRRSLNTIFEWYKVTAESNCYGIDEFKDATEILLEIGGSLGMDIVRDVYRRCGDKKKYITEVTATRSELLRDYILKGEAGSSQGS